MITFKLEDADAAALVSTIVGLHFEPSFQATLVEQLEAQTKVVKEVVEEKKSEEVVAPAPVKKVKKSTEGDK